MTRFVLLGLFLLGGCTFTYIPPLRTSQAPEPRLIVVAASGLEQNETSLKLTLELTTVPEPDWLAVQWFDPGNDEVAAESVWLTPAPEAQTLSVSLPPRVALEDGLWRVVLSYQGKLLRQFSTTVRTP